MVTDDFFEGSPERGYAVVNERITTLLETNNEDIRTRHVIDDENDLDQGYTIFDTALVHLAAFTEERGLLMQKNLSERCFITQGSTTGKVNQ